MKSWEREKLEQIKRKSEIYFDELLNGEAEVGVFAEHLPNLADEIYRMKKIVPMKILSAYNEFFISFAIMCKKCADKKVLKDNVDIIVSSLQLLVECMELIISACKSCDYEEKECPLVSVVLPTYNHEDYVEEAIESILKQTYSNVEILIADDASTDSTVAKIMKYKDFVDKIQLFENNHGGVIKYLVKEAKGKYVAIMHSDDVWAVDKLEQQVEYMETHSECAACFTGCKLINELGREIPNTMFEQINMPKEKWIRYFYENGNCLPHPSVMMRTNDYLENHKKSIKTIRQLPDYWRWIQLLLEKDIYVIEKELTYFRIHEKGENINTSSRNQENMARTQVEETYIWYDIIKNMDNEFFSKAFGDMFERNDPENDIEIMCEKMFVLLNPRSYYCKQAGIFYMFDITKEQEVVEYLEKNYNWGEKNAKKITGDFLFGK